MAITTTNSQIEQGMLVLALPENLGTGTVITVIGSDSEGETIDRIYLYGTHRSLFKVNADNQLVFKGMAQDFEAMPANFSLSLQVVTVDDETDRPTTHVLKNVTVRVSDVDEQPTGLTVAAVTTEIKEGTKSRAVKLADITVADDALGTNTLTVLPQDSPFEYRAVTRAAAELWLKAGTVLDRETIDSLTANLSVDGTTLEATYTLKVLDVNDNAPVLTVGGSQVMLKEGVYDTETDTGIRLTSTDADLGDKVTISVADDRFKVRASDGAVLIISGSEFDHEEMAYPFVSALIEAADTAGNRTFKFLLVRIDDANDNDPSFGGVGKVEIYENSGAGRVVYDPDVTPDVFTDAVAHSLSGPDASNFMIDAKTGELTLLGDPDYESKPVYIVTIKAETRTGQPDARSASQHVVVKVRDGNDLPPHIEPTAVVEVDEGSGAGQVVHTPRAAIPDVEDDKVTYSLSGADADDFTIDAMTGAVTLTGNPDFEVKPFYIVTITALTRAGADDEQSAAQALTVLVTDRPEDKLVLSVSGTQATIIEGAYKAATDTSLSLAIDGLTSLSGITFKVSDNRFAVQDDGGLSVKAGAEFDYEDETDRSIEVSVTASDGQGRRGALSVMVEITNRNDVAPEITSAATGDTLDENIKVNAGSVVYKASGTFDAIKIAWRIKGADSSLFEIDSATGEVTAASALTPNHEAKASYRFTLVADSDGLTDEQEVILPVGDLNDTVPRFVKASPPVLLLKLKENSGADQSLHTFAATPDVEGDEVTFKLLEGSDFRLDEESWTLFLVPDPDFEAKRNHYVKVRATTREGEDDEQHNELWVWLDIMNLNDNVPVISRIGTQAVLTGGAFDEATATGYIYSATDADELGSLKFSVDNAVFKVLEDGQLVVKAGAEIDFDSLNDRKLPIVVTVTDSGGHKDTDALDIIITEVTVEITSAGTAPAINENARVATTDIVYRATGVVTGDAAINWRLKDSDSAHLSIGATSGEVKFRAITTPDHEAKQSYTFTVVAVSGNVEAELEVTLPIADLNDNPPVFATTGLANVMEGGGTRQIVYTPEAAVADVDGDAVLYKLSGNDSSHFTINGQTGALTLSAEPDFETKGAYSVTITAVTRDGKADTKSASQTVTVNVTDFVGSAPVIVKAGSQNTLSEGHYLAEALTGYTYTATDIDDGETLSFSTSDARFLVTEIGELTIKAGSLFDHEAGDGRVSVTVTVTDTERNRDTDTVEIVFADANDVTPSITSSNKGSILPENTKIRVGEAIYTATGIYDVTAIRWSIKENRGDGSSNLHVHPTTGDVKFKVTTTLDHETKTFYTFTLVADSGGLTDELDVTIPVRDLNDTPPKFAAIGSATVTEGSGANKLVYKPSAAVPDVDTDTVVYRLGGADSRHFTIDSRTGNLKLKDNSDFDKKSSYSVTITAITREGSQTDEQSSRQAVTIKVLEVPCPEITSIAELVIGSENTLISKSTAVYTATGTHESKITWSIEGGDHASFSINPNTGQVRFKADMTPDFESKSEYEFTLVASALGCAPDKQTVTLQITDINEAPVLHVSGSDVAFNEGTYAEGNPLSKTFTVIDQDAGDSHTYATSDSRFKIRESDGRLVVIAGSKFNYDKEASISLSVTATDSDRLVDTERVPITIKNINLRPKDLNLDLTAKTREETRLNYETGQTPGLQHDAAVAKIIVIDEDGGDNELVLSGKDSNFFRINGDALMLKAGTILDYESSKIKYEVTVTLVAIGKSKSFTLGITNFKESIYISSEQTATSLRENDTNAIGAHIYTATGLADKKAAITWSIKQGEGDWDSFQINSSSGRVTFAETKAPDYEGKSDYSFTVVASTPNPDQASQEKQVTLAIINEYDTPPVFDKSTAEFSVDENATGTSLQFDLPKARPDLAGESVTYELVNGGDSNDFTFSTGGGPTLTLSSSPDHETKQSYDVIVRAYTRKGQSDEKHADLAVSLTVNDKNDHGPILDTIFNGAFHGLVH